MWSASVPHQPWPRSTSVSILGWPRSPSVSVLDAHLAVVSWLDWSPAALLLLLLCPLWQLAQASPLTGRVSDRCVSRAQTLLHNISGTLAKVGNAMRWGPCADFNALSCWVCRGSCSVASTAPSRAWSSTRGRRRPRRARQRYRIRCCHSCCHGRRQRLLNRELCVSARD